MQTKQCVVCRQHKPIEDFNRRSRSKDGRNAACKNCVRTRAAMERALYKERRNAYDRRRRQENPNYAREWRAAHKERVREYSRSYRQAHPPKPSEPKPKPEKPNLADRFWSNVDKSGECWVWTGNRLPSGYGRFSRNGSAHRIAYQLTYGEIPPGMCVCHRCDNPPCVRPDHLFLGTHAENMRDRDAKGRGKLPKSRW